MINQHILYLMLTRNGLDGDVSKVWMDQGITVAQRHSGEGEARHNFQIFAFISKHGHGSMVKLQRLDAY